MKKTFSAIIIIMIVELKSKKNYNSWDRWKCVTGDYPGFMHRIFLKLQRFLKFEQNPCTSSRNSAIIYNNDNWQIFTLYTLIDYMIADDYNNGIYFADVIFTNNIYTTFYMYVWIFFVFLFRCGPRLFQFQIQTDLFACARNASRGLTFDHLNSTNSVKTKRLSVEHNIR